VRRPPTDPPLPRVEVSRRPLQHHPERRLVDVPSVVRGSRRCRVDLEVGALPASPAKRLGRAGARRLATLTPAVAAPRRVSAPGGRGRYDASPVITPTRSGTRPLPPHVVPAPLIAKLPETGSNACRRLSRQFRPPGSTSRPAGHGARRRNRARRAQASPSLCRKTTSRAVALRLDRRADDDVGDIAIVSCRRDPIYPAHRLVARTARRSIEAHHARHHVDGADVANVAPPVATRRWTRGSFPADRNMKRWPSRRHRLADITTPPLDQTLAFCRL